MVYILGEDAGGIWPVWHQDVGSVWPQKAKQRDKMQIQELRDLGGYWPDNDQLYRANCASINTAYPNALIRSFTALHYTNSTEWFDLQCP